MSAIEEKYHINEIVEKALEQISTVNPEVLDSFYNEFLSKKGKINLLMGMMRVIDPDERASFGAAVNEARRVITEAYEKRKAEEASKALFAKLEKEKIDLSLPGRNFTSGSIDPYHQIIYEVSSIFTSMGYEIYQGRDVETDLYNFELLNVPADHPSRDMQDTFYLEGGKLLRTQTSAAQAHAMREREGKTPIKMICPGKAYRRDDDDMTHSHQFAQIEGLVVDENINIGNLKATLELFAKKMFGDKREIRMRSSYFPFTEPSVEVDVSCFACQGKGCPMCKHTGWIEILGAGMVNPKVLDACGYDSKKWSGFAFGVGVERVAMLRYGIDDIRRFYSDDFRFLQSFKEKK